MERRGTLSSEHKVVSEILISFDAIEQVREGDQVEISLGLLIFNLVYGDAIY